MIDKSSDQRPYCQAILESKKYEPWILNEEELFHFFRNDINKLKYLWKMKNDIEKSFIHLIIKNKLNKSLEEEAITYFIVNLFKDQ
jgi:hypothetical protein